jgi:fructokinase
MNHTDFNPIICFGEVLWDMLPGGAQPGGAPMNVAIHLKRQAINPWLVSKIGQDDNGIHLKKFLADAGLNLQYLQTDPNLPTSQVLVHLDASKNATYDIISPVAWDNIQWSENLEKLAPEAGMVIFGTLAARNKITRITLFQLLASTSAIRVLDVNLRPPFNNNELVDEMLNKADFIKMNNEELVQISRWNGFTGSEYKLIESLAERYNCPKVCITHGEKGAAFFADGFIVEHPGFKVNAVDTVGAGDAFLAGLLAKLADGRNPDEALAYACATGAFVASRQGAVPEYTKKDIEAVLHSRN